MLTAYELELAAAAHGHAIKDLAECSLQHDRANRERLRGRLTAALAAVDELERLDA